MRTCFSLFCTLLLSCSTLISAQTDSIIVSLDHIEYLSGYEKGVFHSIDEKEKKYIKYFAALNGGEPEAEQLNLAIKTYSETLRKDSEKSIKKFAKNMHELLHTNILKYYEEVANINETLEKGKYNCVSATAMYALICEELSVEYQIRETPFHVYTIVDPNGENIILESTDPSKKGYFAISDKFKESYISYLKENKLISPEDTQKLSKDEIFDKSYFSAKIITLRQLAGIQYYNDGLILIEKEEYKKALSQLEKSYFLYPNENVQIYLPLVAGSVIDYSTEAEKNEFSIIPFLSKYANYSTTPEVQSTSLQLFASISENMVMENAEIEKYTVFTDSLALSLNSASTAQEVYYLSNTTLGRYYGFRRQPDKARIYLSKAGRMNKNNVQLQSMLAYSAHEEFRLKMQEPETVLDSLNKFCEEFPAVCEYPELIEMRAFAKIAEVFLKHIDAEDEDFIRQELINTIEEVEELLIKLPPNSQSKIPSLYADIAASEFRKEKPDEAISWLKRGLKFFPENKDLKERLKNMEDFIYNGKY